MRFFSLTVAFSVLQFVLNSAEFSNLKPYERELNEFTIDMAEYKPGATELEFKKKLIDNGFVVLLNAISEEKIDEMHDLLSFAYELALVDDNLDQIESDNVVSSHISEKVFKKYTGRSLAGILSVQVKNLGCYFFSQLFKLHNVTHSRRVKPPSFSFLPFYQFPLPLHLDVFHLGAQVFVLEYWVPLHHCGKDKPTLLVFQSSLDDNYSISSYDFDNQSFNSEQVANIEKGEAPFLKELPCYYLVLNKGDIVILTNWTLYSGYASEEMSKVCWNVEIRSTGNTFWYTP